MKKAFRRLAALGLMTGAIVGGSATSYAADSIGTVTAAKLYVRAEASMTSTPIHALWQNMKVTVIGEYYGWYQIRLSDGRTGWVSGTYLNVQDDVQNKADAAIKLAKEQLGKPYQWGAEGPNAFDCSGLTQYVFKQVGYTLNRISRDQAFNGVYVRRSDVKPGDLMFFSLAGNGAISHVGIYIGNGQMIHSPKAGDVVKITNVETGFWYTNYITARRIIY